MFRLNREERAQMSVIIYDERRSRSGGRISLDSVDRALRRIDAGVMPRNRTEREALQQIYSTKGMRVENQVPPPQGGEEIEEEEGEEFSNAAQGFADSAAAAREQAQELIDARNAEMEATLQAMKDEAQRKRGKPEGRGRRGRRRDSPTYYHIRYVEYVQIERVSNGERASMYDPFEGNLDFRTARGNLDAFYALYEVGRTLEFKV